MPGWLAAVAAASRRDQSRAAASSGAPRLGPLSGRQWHDAVGDGAATGRCCWWPTSSWTRCRSGSWSSGTAPGASGWSAGARSRPAFRCVRRRRAPAALLLPASLGQPDPGQRARAVAGCHRRACTEIAPRVIAQHGGAALFIDYGRAAMGLGETLQSRPRDIAMVQVLEAPGTGRPVRACRLRPGRAGSRAKPARPSAAGAARTFLSSLGTAERARSLKARRRQLRARNRPGRATNGAAGAWDSRRRVAHRVPRGDRDSRDQEGWDRPPARPDGITDGLAVVLQPAIGRPGS